MHTHDRKVILIYCPDYKRYFENFYLDIRASYYSSLYWEVTNSFTFITDPVSKIVKKKDLTFSIVIRIDLYQWYFVCKKFLFSSVINYLD